MHEHYHGSEQVQVGNSVGLHILHTSYSTINIVAHPLLLHNILHVPNIAKHHISIHIIL